MLLYLQLLRNSDDVYAYFQSFYTGPGEITLPNAC